MNFSLVFVQVGIHISFDRTTLRNTIRPGSVLSAGAMTQANYPESVQTIEGDVGTARVHSPVIVAITAVVNVGWPTMDLLQSYVDEATQGCSRKTTFPSNFCF